jgi:hypothetical protein
MTPRSATRAALRTWLVLVTAGVPSWAQPTATLTGALADSNGNAVALARLSLAGGLAFSDSAGRFRFAGLPAGPATLSVRRLGFAPRDVSVELVAGRTDSVSLVLAMIATELAGVTSETMSTSRVMLSEFYRHKQSGAGKFFERKDIVALRVFKLSEMLRRVAGVRVSTDRNGRPFIRMTRSGGRNCPPDYWVDGVRSPYLNIDDIPVSDIEALEVYSGEAGVPPELNNRFGNINCGAIVIWTRLPG